MNETLQNLKTRRAVHVYLTRQVEPSLLDAVLEAGTYAPTGSGRQSPVIVAVQDEATVRQLSRMNAAVNGSSGDPFTVRRPCWSCSRINRSAPTFSTARP